MRIFYSFATTALLFLTTAHADTASQVARLGISGWYDCDLTVEDLSKSCIDPYLPNDEPAVLDPTGNTCYMNPLETSNTTRGVHWFGPSPNNDGQIHLYSILLWGNETIGLYEPYDCTNGACSCERVEPYRGDWRNGDCGGIGPGCSSSATTNLNDLVGHECAVFFRQTTNDDTGLAGSCFVSGTLVDVTATPTISPSPTSQPTTTSAGGGVYFGGTVTVLTLLAATLHGMTL